MTTTNTLEPEVQAPKDPLQDLHERGLLSSFDEGDSSLAVIASQELGRRHDEWTNTFDTATSNMMNLPRLAQTESYQSGSLSDRLAKVDRMHDYNETLVAKPVQEDGEDDDAYAARLESQREKHKNGEVPFPLVSDSHSSRVTAQRNLDKGLVTAADKAKTAPLWSRALWGEAKDAYITFATSERTAEDMEAFGDTMDNVRGELIDGESRALLQPLLEEAPLTPATIAANLSESLGIDFDEMDTSKRNIKLSSFGDMKGSIVTRADGSVDHLNITLGDDTDINTASLNKAMHSGARVYLQTGANSDSYNDPRAAALYEKQLMEDGTPFTAPAHNMKKMSAAKEKQWIDSVVDLAASDIPEEKKAQGLLLLGASLSQITERVDRGVLAVHAGEYIAKSLYSSTVIPSDRKDPEAFAEWLTKNPTLKTRRDKLINRFKERTREEPNWLIKPVQWAGNTAVDVFGKNGMDRELSELRSIDEKWVTAWASRNAGKVGVGRENVLKAYGDGVDTMDELDVSSWDLSKEAWRGATQNAFGSTIGIFSGMAAMGVNKLGGLVDENLDEVANTIFRRNHESYQSWMKGLETNVRLHFKDEGKALDKQARDAESAIFAHIDSKGKYLSPEEEVEYARKFKELTNNFANNAHGRMAFATTADSFLNDFGTPADYDPQKNTAMAAELYGYMRTGNPAHKMRFTALSLMNPEQRKIQMDQSVLNEELSGSGSKLFQGFFGGMTAGWQELGVEAVSNLVGLKLAGVVARAKHLRQADKAMLGGAHKGGLASNRTFRDLARFSESAPKTFGKFRTKLNTAGRMAGGVVPGAVGEAFEELYVELGNPAITGASAFEAMKQGFMGGGGIGAIQVAAMTPSALKADEITENNIGILNNRQIIADRQGITAALEDAFSPLTAEAVKARAAESTDSTRSESTEAEFLGGVMGARATAEAEFAELTGQTGSTQSKATAAMARREDAQEALHTAQREHQEKPTAATEARLDAAEAFAEIADAYANEVVGEHNAKGEATSAAAGETATSQRPAVPGAPVDDSTAPALTFDEANAKDIQDAAPPAPKGDPALQEPSKQTSETKPSEEVSEQLVPHSTENVEPAPTWEGAKAKGQSRADYKAELDAWEEKHNRTHERDGTPIVRTKGEEVRLEVAKTARSWSFDDSVDRLGVDANGIEMATAVNKLLDDGWVWDGERFTNPSNPKETPIDGLKRLRAKENAPAQSQSPAAPATQTAPASPAAPKHNPKAKVYKRSATSNAGFTINTPLSKLTPDQLTGLEKSTLVMLKRARPAVEKKLLLDQLSDVRGEIAHRATQKSTPAPTAPAETSQKKTAPPTTKAPNKPSQTSSDTSNTNPLIGFQTHPGDNSAYKGFIAEFAAIKHRDSLTAQTGKSYHIVQKDGKYWLQETAAAVVAPGAKAGTISTGLARNKRWAKVAKDKRVQNAVQVIQSLGVDIRFQRDSKSGTANATAAEMTDGSMRVTLYAHGLKQSAEEVALTLIHESKHIGQYLYERTAEGKLAAKKAEKMFVEGHAMYDQKLNDYMRKEYPKWDARTPRSKLREATRAVLEGLESGETTGFRKGIYSYIKAFLKHVNALLKDHQTFSTYVEGVKAQLDTISKLEDTAQETVTKDAAPPAEVKAPAPEITPSQTEGPLVTKAPDGRRAYKYKVMAVDAANSAVYYKGLKQWDVDYTSEIEQLEDGRWVYSIKPKATTENSEDSVSSIRTKPAAATAPVDILAEANEFFRASTQADLKNTRGLFDIDPITLQLVPAIDLDSLPALNAPEHLTERMGATLPTSEQIQDSINKFNASNNLQEAVSLLTTANALEAETAGWERRVGLRVLRQYRDLIVSQPSEAYKAVRGIFPSRDASGRKRSLSEVIGERDSFRHAAVIDVMQEQSHLRSIGLHPHLGGSNRNFARARALMEFYDSNLSPATIGHLMTGDYVTVKPNDAVLADMYGLLRQMGWTPESIFNDIEVSRLEPSQTDVDTDQFRLARRIFNVLRANGAVSEVNFTGVKQRAGESDSRFKMRLEREPVTPRTTYADTFSPSLRKEYNENVAGRVDIGSSILFLQSEPSSSGELTIDLLAPNSLTSTQKVRYDKKRRTNVQFTIGGRMATRFLWRVADGSVAKEVKQRVAARDIAAVLTHNGNGITGAMPKRGEKHQSVQAVFDSIRGLEAASNTTVEGGLPFPAAFDSSFGTNDILPQHFRWLKSMGVMFDEIQKHAELTGFDTTLSPGTLYAADMQKLVANAMAWYDIVMVKQKGEFAGAAQKEGYMKQFNNVIRRVNNVSNLVSEFGKQMQNQEFTVGSKLFDSSILDEIEGKDDVVNITAVDLLHRLENNMFKENAEYAESFNVDGTTRMDFQNKDDAERNDDMISSLREFGLKKKNENGEKARARRSTMLAVLFDLNIPEAKRWAAQWRTEDGLDNALFEKLTDRVKQSEGTGRTSPEVAYLYRILRGGKLDLRAVLGRLDVAKHVSNNALNGESVEDVATRVQNEIRDRLNGDVDWFESTNDQLIQNSKNLSSSSSLYGYLGVLNVRVSNILDNIGLNAEQKESVLYSGVSALSTRDGIQKLQSMFPKLGKSAASQLRLLLKAMHTASVYAKALEGRQSTLDLALAHATGEAAQLNSPTKPMSTKEGLDELFGFIEQLPPNKLEVMPTSRGLVLGIGDMEGDLVNPSDLLASRLAVEYANVPFVFYDGTGMDKKGVDYNTSLVMTDSTGAVTAVLVDSSDDFFSSGFERVVDQLLLHTFDNGLGKGIAASLEEVKKSLDASLRGDLGEIYTKASNDAMVAVLKDNTKKQRGVSQEVAETLVYNDAFQKSAAEQRQRVLSNAQQEAVKYLQGVRRRRTSAIGRINVPTNAAKQTQGQAYVDFTDGLPLFSEMSNSEFLFRMMRDPQMMNIAQAVDVSSLAVLGLRHSTGKQFLQDADVYVESMGRHFPSGKDQQASDIVENTEVDGDAAVSSPQSFGTIFGGITGNSLIVRDVVGSGLKAVSDGRIKNTKVANEELTAVMEGYADARKNSSRKQGSDGVAVLVTDFEDGSARTAIRNERFQNKLNQPFTKLVDSNGNGVQYTDQMSTRDAQYDAIMNKSSPLHLATGMATIADIEYGNVAYKSVVGPHGLFSRQKAELTKLVAQAETLTDILDKADELISMVASVPYDVRLKHATHLQALSVIEDQISMLHESLGGMNEQLMASNAAKDATIKNYKIRHWELHKQRQRDQRKGVGEKAELVNSMLDPLSEAGAAFDNGVEAAVLHFDKHIKLSAEARQEMEEADIGTVHEEDSAGSSAPIPPTTPSTPTTITQPLSALSAPGASAATLVLGKALQLKVLNLALASNAPFKAAYESNPSDPVVIDLMGMIASMAEMFEDTRSTQAVKNTARYTMNMFIRGNVAAAKLSGYGLMANVTSEDAARTMVNGVYSQFKRKLTDHRRSSVDTMLSQDSDANEYGNDIFGRVDMGMRGNSGRSGWGREMLDFKDLLDTLSRRITAPALTYAYVASQIGSVSGGSKLTETQQIEANLDYLEGGVNINKKWLGHKRSKVASGLRSQDAPTRLAIKQARAWLVKHAGEADAASKLDIHMQGLMSPEQASYIKAARDWFSAREAGLRLMHMQEGRALGHFDRYLPVRGWDLNESQGPDVGADELQLKASDTHAKTRFNHKDQTRGLDLDPTRAILSVANSMSYQMNTNGVNSFYDNVFGTDKIKSQFDQTVDKLSGLSSEDVIKLHFLNEALAVELTMLKANDLNHVHHDGWFMRALSFSGSVGFRVSLTSLQQTWLQTAPVVGAYALRDAKKTPAVMSALARLISTAPVKGVNRMLDSDVGNYNQHVSDLIKHVSPQLFSRSVDGVNEMKDVLDTISMSDLTGILDKVLNTPRAALGVVNKGYDAMLSLSTAVPDSALVRAIFAANYETATGKPIDANSVANLDQVAARQAKDAAEGEMALSDRSTKSPLFQPHSHAGKEAARRALIVFSNHLLTLAPNARAGRAMMKSDDPVMRAEGRARVKDFVAQAMLFNLFKVKNLVFVAAYMASRGYDDEKDRDKALAENQKGALQWWADHTFSNYRVPMDGSDFMAAYFLKSGLELTGLASPWLSVAQINNLVSLFAKAGIEAFTGTDIAGVPSSGMALFQEMVGLAGAPGFAANSIIDAEEMFRTSRHDYELTWDEVGLLALTFGGPRESRTRMLKQVGKNTGAINKEGFKSRGKQTFYRNLPSMLRFHPDPTQPDGVSYTAPTEAQWDMARVDKVDPSWKMERVWSNPNRPSLDDGDSGRLRTGMFTYFDWRASGSDTPETKSNTGQQWKQSYDQGRIYGLTIEETNKYGKAAAYNMFKNLRSGGTVYVAHQDKSVHGGHRTYAHVLIERNGNLYNLSTLQVATGHARVNRNIARDYRNEDGSVERGLDGQPVRDSLNKLHTIQEGARRRGDGVWARIRR